MIFVKFILTNGEITVDEAQAKEILKSEAQLVPIRDFDGGWTYETINKAFIVRTVKDFEKMRWWKLEQERNRQIKLENEEEKKLLEMSPEEKQKIEDSKENIRKMFADIRQGMKIGNK